MMGVRDKARGLSARSLHWGVLVTSLVVATAAIAAESPRDPGQPRRIGTQSPAPVQPPRSGTLAAAPNIEPPPCEPPPLPVPTYPPGAVYGVPFVAQLSAADLLSGYDLSLAAKGQYPWRAEISNITGWATGLLLVPALKAQVQRLIFCYQGLQPPQGPGQRGGIIIRLRTPGAPTTTNVGHCIGSHSTPGFQDDRVTLTPDPNIPTSLAITGVEPDGSLDLTGTQAASTKIDFYQCPTPPVPTQVCRQFGPTQLTFATRVSPPPPTAPPGVMYPFTPKPLHGVINEATADLVGNDFAVPAFRDVIRGGCGLSFALNGSLAGFDLSGFTRYPYPQPGQPQPKIAGEPGWAQFKTSTQITQVG